MAFTKTFLPLLACAGAAWAASSTTSSSSSSSSSCPDANNGAFTITSQSDADQFQDCSTFDGTIIIDSSVSGNLEINGVQQVTGNLSCTNATSLTSISTDQLNSIGGYFFLNELTILSTLQMSSLSSVNVINFEALPNLQSLSFDSGVETAQGVRIVNTQLSSLSGLSLSSVGAFDITNNPYLTEFNVNNLESISDYSIIQANGQNLDIEFPNLLTAENMTFGNISTLSMPSLANITGSLGLYSNNVKSLALSNITTIGNAFVVADNSELTNLSMPLLYTVGGGFTIVNNTKLTNLSFPDMKGVGGAFEVEGNFSSVDIPQLADVKGGFTMESSDSDFDCSAFNKDRSSSAIHGTYTCTAKASSASSSSSSSSSSGSSSSSSKKSAAYRGFDLPIMPVAMAMVGFVAGLLVI